MKTLIVESNWLKVASFPHGWGNGYVLIPKGHKCYNIDYDTLYMSIEIHGGITYAQYVHEDDYKHFPGLTKEDIGKRMIGFDTKHYMDTLEKWPKERVQEEADKLLKQLQEYEQEE